MSAPNSNGPSTGVICMGHLLSSTPSAMTVEISTRNPLLSSNIQLKQAHIIEGIHIVPKHVTPPGFDIEGKTSPDISQRPFNLIITARNVDSAAELIHILSLTITGGCQWVPISPPFNSIAIDSLVFQGDFEIISLIIHGIKIDTAVLSAEAQRVVLHQPLYNTNNTINNNNNVLKINDENDGGNNEDNEDEDEEEMETNEINDMSVTPPSTLVVIPKNVLLALESRFDTCSTQINPNEKKLTSSTPLSLIQRFSRRDASKGCCVVAVEAVAELVGAIFSMEDDGSCSSPLLGVRIVAVENLTEMTRQCWKVCW